MSLSLGLGPVEALEQRLVLTTSTWNGLLSTLWSDGGNWFTPPAENNDLAFPAGAANLANSNDLAAGMNFGSLSVTGAGYSIGGNAIGLSGSIDASQDAGSSTVSLPIDLNGADPATVTVDNNGATLALGGLISGPGGLTKNGLGELDLSADNTYAGATTVAAGTLKIDGNQGGSAVTLDAGTVLEGAGTVASLFSNGGTVSPGGPSTAILTDLGDASLPSGSTFAVALNGPTAGTDYSQLAVAGQVTLANANLNVTLGFTPTANASFVLVNNTGSDPVSGTFANLVEGATVTVNGQPFQISYDGGDGNDVVLTALAASATTLSTSTSTSVVGQSVTLTATVASADPGVTDVPTGTVEFFTGAVSLGTAPLDGTGTASLDTSGLVLGDNAVTAQYDGDGTYAESTSATSHVMVAQASSTTSVTATPNPSPYGQSVALTATVAAISPGGGTPTGTVEFFNGTTDLGPGTLSVGGVATLNTTTLPVGDNSITAQYLGDANYSASTSLATTETINEAATTTALGIVPNPSGLGQSVTLTATVTPINNNSPTPTGTVEFFNGSTALGPGTLNGSGVATLMTTTLALGSNPITAQYVGDGNFSGSTSTATTASVDQASTTALSASPTSIVFGQAVMLTATVAGSSGSGTPTGSVNFLSGSTVLGSVALNGGLATLSTTAIPVGTNAITAQYLGDSTFAGSTSGATTVTVTQTTSSTVLGGSPNPGGLGQLVTLTATISTPGGSTITPTGTVNFFSGSAALGSGTLNASGVATFTTTALTLGNNSLTATYQGDTNYSGSTSPAFIETINQASATTLNVSATTPLYGQPVTLTANVTAITGTGIPTGSVEFLSGTVSLGTGVLNSNGTASLATSSLILGTNSVTAQYLGDATFAGSTSSAATVTVTQASSSTVVTASPDPSGFGQPVTLTATVAPLSPAGGTPTGTVEFLNGTTSLGTGTLTGGVATLSTTALTLGSNSITADYSGDTNFAASVSPAITTTVNQSSTTVSLTVSKTNPVSSEAITLTATVAGPSSSATATGTVDFFANGVMIGSGTLTGGKATFVTASLALGNETLTAVYEGDSNFNSATSPGVSIVVGDSTERFINQVYLDALGRAATQQDLDYWRTELAVGVPVKRVVHEIITGSEGQAAYVQKVFQTFLRRPATTAEVTAALSPASVSSGVGLESRVLGTREYFEEQGAGTIYGFITALYLDTLGTSDVPAADRAALTAQLQNGVSTTDVAQEVLTSHDGRVALINYLYQSILNRPADPQGAIDLLGLINDGGRLNQARIALFTSEEFRAMFDTTS